MMSEHSHTVTEREVQADLDSADKMAVSKIRCIVQHISRDEIESAIDTELAASEWHRQRSAIADLRAGALFLCLKSQMGSGYSGFWKHCETRFKVHRATVSRKMRLAVKWLAANGGNPKLITELAQAAELDPAKLKTAPKAVQLAFDWIGGQTTTELYRKYKLVNYGPQNTGKLLGDPKKGRHTGENIQLKKQAEAGGAAATLGEFLDEFLNNKIYEQLTDADLQHLRERVVEFETVVSNLALARKLKRLPDNWRLLESQP